MKFLVSLLCAVATIVACHGDVAIGDSDLKQDGLTAAMAIDASAASEKLQEMKDSAITLQYRRPTRKPTEAFTSSKKPVRRPTTKPVRRVIPRRPSAGAVVTKRPVPAPTKAPFSTEGRPTRSPTSSITSASPISSVSSDSPTSSVSSDSPTSSITSASPTASVSSASPTSSVSSASPTASVSSASPTSSVTSASPVLVVERPTGSPVTEDLPTSKLPFQTLTTGTPLQPVQNPLQMSGMPQYWFGVKMPPTFEPTSA